MKAKTTVKDKEADMVALIIDGLRGEALQCAKRIGVDELCEPGGIQILINEVKKLVYPNV